MGWNSDELLADGRSELMPCRLSATATTLVAFSEFFYPFFFLWFMLQFDDFCDDEFASNLCLDIWDYSIFDMIGANFLSLLSLNWFLFHWFQFFFNQVVTFW